jgi:hypothetical protein
MYVNLTTLWNSPIFVCIKTTKNPINYIYILVHAKWILKKGFVCLPSLTILCRYVVCKYKLQKRRASRVEKWLHGFLVSYQSSSVARAYRSVIQSTSALASRVARFFLTQCTKKGKNVPNYLHNGRNVFQRAIKYTNAFQSKDLQDLPKLGFGVRKHTIWQPCSREQLKGTLAPSERKVEHNSFRKLRTSYLLLEVLHL